MGGLLTVLATRLRVDQEVSYGECREMNEGEKMDDERRTRKREDLKPKTSRLLRPPKGIAGIK